MKVPGRAYTNEEKEAVCAAILAAWKDAPHQRLGQLIDNALHEVNAHPGLRNEHHELFFVEDDKLVSTIVDFVINHPVETHINEDGECTTCGFPHNGPCDPNS